MNPIITSEITAKKTPTTPQLILGVSESLNKATVRITPEQAQELLDRHNGNNRDVVPGLVAAYCKDMLAGEFEDSDSQILFDTEGNLANGQHRLLAVVKSGVPQVFDVKFNVSPDVRFRCDVGRKRNLTDHLVLLGKKPTKFSGSILNAMLEEKYHNKMNHTVIGEWFDRFVEELRFAEGLTYSQDLKFSCYKAAFACAAHHFKNDPKKMALLTRCAEILNGQVKPCDLAPGRENDLYLLRLAIIQNEECWKIPARGQKGRLPIMSRFQAIIKAFVMKKPLPKFSKITKEAGLRRVFPSKVQPLKVDHFGIDD